MYDVSGPISDKKGILQIEDMATTGLADDFGTPLYVLSEGRIRENYRRLLGAFSKLYSDFKIYYAVKANNNPAVLSILRQEGACADCSCPEEIELARMAGFTSSSLMYTGNFNSDAQLAAGLASGAIINLDDDTILPRLMKIGKPHTLSFRINPGMGEGKYKGLVFGGSGTKFGIEEKKAVRAYAKAKKAGIRNFGIHMMAGSCVLREEYFSTVTEMLMTIAGKIKKETGITFDFINIGGGFGVPYKHPERELDIKRTARLTVNVFKRRCEENQLGTPSLYIEPGRYIVCDAGLLLTRVHHIKSAGDTTFAGTDAGMNTLLRPALYNAHHEIFIANDLRRRGRLRQSVCGQVCENTDILARDRSMPPIREGDLLAILNAGAYGYSMASNYNTRGRPAEALVNGKNAELIRVRETVKDLADGTIIPSRLRK